MKRPTVPQALLLLGALLAPISGGYVASDGTKIDPADFVGSMGSGQAPVLQHALLALPVLLAFVVLLLRRRIQQIPSPYVGGALALFVGGLLMAVAVSSYRAVSVVVWVEWAVYAAAFFAAISGLGRRLGPLAVLGAVFAGTAWIARIGVLEYLDMRRIDPTWRVFCGWNNPNAAAAMLTLGFFCALGFPRPKERTAGLLLNLGVIVGGGMTLLALLLTGSKGATLLALPTGLVAFGLVAGKRHPGSFVAAFAILALVAVGFLKSMPILGVGSALLFAIFSLLPYRVHLGRLLAAGAFAGLMLASFAGSAPGGSRVTSATRMGAASATQDQSSTFRLNLWKSAVALAKERPVTGWGLGSFRYESARPGLVTATIFSHNSYLQLAAEAGVGALGVFLVFLGLWARRALRGSSRLPEGQRLPFAAAIGGVAAILAHCLVDSDFSTFGLGLAFFLVLGAASLLAADAVAPEFVPAPSRYATAGFVGLIGIVFLWLAAGDDAKSGVRFTQASGQPGDIASLEGLAAWDGDAAYLRARTLPLAEAQPGLKTAFALLPIPKVGRRLADVQAKLGNPVSAESTLGTALVHDPQNLPTLYALMQTQRSAEFSDRAEETARRIVAVEKSPYFKIRSLPELVPTETYFARLFLAEGERDPRRKADLIAAAVRGLRLYADTTLPPVRRSAKGGADFAGETLQGAVDKVTIGANAAQIAASLYRSLGDGKAAAEMEAQAAALRKAATP